ncbi:hypothetical protein EIP86_001312 [Pleurotus ostreatoroseus]|nr:hypothetical protein EIP86_001312 [Pleurotus ostreatoroseus]
MTTEPNTPLRRSKRGQPMLSVAGPSGSDSRTGEIQAGRVELERPTILEDLSDSQRDKFEEDEYDIEDFLTRFYYTFERKETTNSVHGKGKRPAITSVETYKIGDTVVVDTTPQLSIAVITAIWDVVGPDGEILNNVAIHWFLKPTQLASYRARREHLSNEVYYTLESNTTIPISMIRSHCTVSGDPNVTADYYCLSALDGRKGLYYEFQWEELRDKAVEMPDISDAREQWNLSAQEIANTPAKRRTKPSQLANKEDDVSFGGVIGLHKHHDSDTSDDELPVAKPSPRKRKRPSSANKSSRKRRPRSSDSEEPGNKSESSDDADSSDEYTEMKNVSESEDDVVADSSEDEAEQEDEDEDEDDFGPRTPSRRGRRPGPRTPRTPRTPHNKRGRAYKLAAPTPHSKAALRARASRKRARALPAQALVGAHDLAALQKLPKDPWIRAMHVLHVASRPDALPCRQEEYGRILRAVEELLDEGSGGCVFIGGVPGTGKTATVHAVIRELKRMAEQDEGNPFTYVEINGLRIPDPSAAYGLLWEAISGHDVAKEGHLKISSKEALKQLTRYFSSSEGAGPGGHACVVLMDELDQLLTTKQDVVYNFFNWPTLVGCKLVVVAVANTFDLPERVMTGRVRSRLGMTRIKFDPYKREQLIEIINSRLLAAKTGMPADTQDVIAPDGIKIAAMKVSNISGDARRVLDILRRAVETVHPQRKTAKADVVNRVISEMQNSPIAAFLRELSFHERIMLAAMILCVRKEGVEEVKWGKV